MLASLAALPPPVFSQAYTAAASILALIPLALFLVTIVSTLLSLTDPYRGAYKALHESAARGIRIAAVEEGIRAAAVRHLGQPTLLAAQGAWGLPTLPPEARHAEQYPTP